MTTQTQTIPVKTVLLSLIALAVFTISPGIVRADEIKFRVHTVVSEGDNSPSATLTFIDIAVSVDTVGGTASAPLGGFRLQSNRLLLNTPDFTLRSNILVEVIDPSTGIGILFGSAQAMFTASVSYTTHVVGGGINIIDTATLTFDPATLSQTFTVACGGNPRCALEPPVIFTFTIPPTLTVQAGGFVNLVATLTRQQPQSEPTATPEPATLLLLGTGLTGIAAQLRKRRKARLEN